MTSLVNMNVHHLTPHPTASLLESAGGDPMVSLSLSDHPAQVNVFLRSRAECDALIKGALAARDLLPAPVPLAGLRDRPHYTPNLDAIRGAPTAPDNSCVGYGEEACLAETETDPGTTYTCLAARGHTGYHMAYGANDGSTEPEVCHSWPQDNPAAAWDAPLPPDVSGDLLAIPANRIGDPAPVPTAGERS